MFCAVVCFHCCDFLHFLCLCPSGALESPAPEQQGGSPGGLPSVTAPSGGPGRLLPTPLHPLRRLLPIPPPPPTPPLLGALAAFDRAGRACTACPLIRWCAQGGVWSPHGQPPRCALTWVTVCSEGRPVAFLLGSCDPKSSVSVASAAFPRKGSWAEATSSASLSPRAAGGWSSGSTLWAGAHPAELCQPLATAVSSLHAHGPLSVLVGVFYPG